MLFIWSIIMFSVMGGSYEQTIEPNQREVYAEVDSNVLLSCNYSSAYSLLWYKQSPGSAPQYLLLILDSTGTEHRADSLDSRFSGKLNKEKTRVYLEISSAEVTDSALFYCALRPTGTRTLIFGSGTEVFVQSREKHDPSYYRLNSSNTTACLATDFSAHDANTHLELFNKTEATRVNGDSYYSQVALRDNCSTIEGGGSEKCEANWYFDTDAKINFLSLTILGLRILFLKTIVFNVLMTLRLWMS